MTQLASRAQYYPQSEEAGEARFYLRFVVGATGAVPATFVRKSDNITSVTRQNTGLYLVVFDTFFVPGYSASNPAGTMGANLGASPMLEVHAKVVGSHATSGTNATAVRVRTDNTNNQDASGSCYVQLLCEIPGGAPADIAQNDELCVVFTLKTERP